jgi:hypothetical protein
MDAGLLYWAMFGLGLLMLALMAAFVYFCAKV